MSQQTLQSFFKREPKRARDDELATSSPASSFAAPPPPPAAAASSSSAPLAAVKQRVVSTFRAERAHKAAKSERAPGESLGLKFDFAEPENLRDAQGRRPSDPDYDSRTVFVPQEQYLRMTPFERQFWDVKRKLFDTIVFFRKGMFYELFEADARIAQREFGMTFTLRASMVMVGFPATQFEQRASVLLAKGFRVARVDQAESAIGAEKRLKAGGRELEEKVIRRAVTEILTPGTLQDPQMDYGGVAPKFISVWEGENRVFGVCVVESATHTLWLGSFVDDARLGHLETLVLRTQPAEAVLCRGACSSLALALLRARVRTRSLVQVREPGNDFWEPERTRRVLESAFDTARMPRLLQLATAGSGDAALLWAAGGALSYLEEIGQLQSILSSLKLERFDALPVGHVALDGTTLLNLEVLEGPTSLLRLLDHTVSTQGARLFRQWVSAPLVDHVRIADRLVAVDVLRANADFSKLLRAELKHIPDLDRLVALCASGVCSAAKIATLVLGMQRAWNAVVSRFRNNRALRTASMRSFEYVGDSLTLEEVAAVSASTGAAMEELLGLASNWTAVKGGDAVLEPSPGTDEQADLARGDMDAVKKVLDGVLKQAREQFGTHDVVYTDIGKTRYLLDAPASVRNRALQSGFRLVNSTKNRDRFSNSLSEAQVERLLELEDTMASRCQVFLAVLQQKVVSHSESFAELNAAVSQLDALLSLAAFADAHPGELCRPHVLERGGTRSWLEAHEFRHPICLLSSNGHIANSLVMGGAEPSTVLVTGPNMAGKSTLLRAVCSLAIMAQIGAWVPAQSFRMTAMDRIFTRIGARDDIFAGQSTFMQEMLETSAVLNFATSDSLVVLDELGRGTSTHDGHAIAFAVLSELEKEVCCRTLFSTHYLGLVDDFDSVRVQKRMMSYLATEDGLVFLYKLVLGVTESSFGMNVARMAGLSPEIIRRAEELARDMQTFRSKSELAFAHMVRRLL